MERRRGVLYSTSLLAAECIMGGSCETSGTYEEQTTVLKGNLPPATSLASFPRVTAAKWSSPPPKLRGSPSLSANSKNFIRTKEEEVLPTPPPHAHTVPTRIMITIMLQVHSLFPGAWRSVRALAINRTRGKLTNEKTTFKAYWQDTVHVPFATYDNPKTPVELSSPWAGTRLAFLGKPRLPSDHLGSRYPLRRGSTASAPPSNGGTRNEKWAWQNNVQRASCVNLRPQRKWLPTASRIVPDWVSVGVCNGADGELSRFIRRFLPSVLVVLPEHRR
ncbi:hypothetical protein BJV77DRAFT_962080 [Russula vinacea]|nr:hypothetical protein BJV77DRAFT_962080 [Russula vinacea]